MCNEKYVRFDWAIKHVLRDKANFEVLEGLISVLIGESVHIVEILESEGNQNAYDDKFNRVDIKARNDKGHIIIIEVQLAKRSDYLRRVLYGVSKSITEHIKLGQRYDTVPKVYSIGILYYDLGQGEDYLYHGKTIFEGCNLHDRLPIDEVQREAMLPTNRDGVFPEYYLLCINNFDKLPDNHLDEWFEYLKTGYINPGTTAPGLRAAREKLQYLKMTESERLDYERHLDNVMVENDIIGTAEARGRAEGVELTAVNMLREGMDVDLVAKVTGLSADRVTQLKSESGIS